jgi:hypothetical protein
MKKNPYHLYWVTDEDGAEDWFVAARTPRSAARFYEDYIGMDKNEATAELVLRNIDHGELECGTPPCWLSLNDLKSLGFTVLSSEPGLSAVALGNRTFREGYFETLLRVSDKSVSTARASEYLARIRCSGKPSNA